MASRVFLILGETTAAVLHEVLAARIDVIDDTECNNPEVRACMAFERERLATVVGQLKAPA